MRFRTILLRSLRLRCPACGQGPLFRGWIAMHEACDHCGLKFQREPGFFLGAIYFNYGLTALVLVISFFSLYLGLGIRPNVLLWPLTAFCLLFPLWFFRYSRALWLGFDQYWDPRETGPRPRT